MLNSNFENKLFFVARRLSYIIFELFVYIDFCEETNFKNSKIKTNLQNVSLYESNFCKLSTNQQP